MITAKSNFDCVLIVLYVHFKTTIRCNFLLDILTDFVLFVL